MPGTLPGARARIYARLSRMCADCVPEARRRRMVDAAVVESAI
jgi:hypothetical protein